ncbi:hypothetical protein [Rouxiella sp. Mn2063]|uniref:hypothetical protein n=1 Tax=Rouxiella sp. Mn2063 TaxID=3395262 RepID=UPI003BE9F966
MQEHGKDVLSCSTDPDSESCHRGQAVNKAIAVALGAGAAGGTAIAVTPEIISIAQAAMGACNSNPVQCVNEVAIWAAEMSMGDALPVGFGVIATRKITKEQLTQLAEMKAIIAVDKQTGNRVTKESLETIAVEANTAKNTGKSTIGSLTGQPTKFPPNAAAEEIRSLTRENESASILSKSGYHVEQKSCYARCSES